MEEEWWRMKVSLFDCAVFEQMDVRGTRVFGHEHQRERGCWSLIFLFIVSYWQYDILMNTDRRNVSQVQLHIEQDTGSFWISWLSFYHNFRGVISEATQHFTSCYKFLKWQTAADLFSVRSRRESGAGSIIRRRKDRPPCARLFVWDWNRKWSGFGSGLLGLTDGAE